MISVLIPVYNGEKYIFKAIESVIAQTYADYEIIVVDDGSTDDTAMIVKSFPMVKYVHQPHSGVSVARNRGIRESRGSVIAFIDADDMFAETKLERQAAYLSEHPDCMICYTEISNFTDLNVSELTDRQSRIMNARVENILPSACIRRSVFSVCGFFDVNLPYGEDTEWIHRVKLMNVGEIHTIEEKLYLRRIHNENLSLTHEFKGAATMKPILAKGAVNSIMMRSGRKVSVIIPAYNAEKYLEEALESVYRQNWLGEIEIIVVDNNSTDNTLKIAKQYNCIVLSEPRRGAAFARNAGIAAASGDFIFLLDADDYLCENAADILFKPMYGAKETQCVFAKSVDFISNELSDAEKAKIKVRSGPYGGCLPGCSLIRRSVFEKVGLFDTNLSSGETVDWMIRLKDSKIKTVYLDEVVLNRRLHLTNTSRIAAEDERKNYAAILRKRMKIR